MTDLGPFEMEIPANPAWLGASRTFCTAVADRASLDPAVTDDLRLAVSEGLSAMIALRDVAPADGGLRLSISQNGSLRVRIEDLGISHGGETRAENRATITELGVAKLDVIKALFPNLSADTTPTARLRLSFSIG